jgi:aspartyl aminopeptidase
MNHIEKMIDLLNHSYSAFHAVKNIEEELKTSGFEELDEKANFNLKLGGNYYVKRNGTSIIAFRIPEKLEGFAFQLTATHNDSPTFKIKPNPVVRFQNLMSLNVEPYGGLIYNTWLDKPLSFAGRVMVKVNDKIETRLLAIDEDLLIIPNVAIHMNREINSGFVYNAARDLIPLFGTNDCDFDFKKYLLTKLGLKNGEVLSFDLYLYNRQEARLVGLNKEFLASGRLDDLSAAYSALMGFIEAKEAKNINVLASFDNEEVGSLTKQGANSTFLQDILKRIVTCLGGNKDDYQKATASSMLLSIDNAHANHPNHPEYTDKTTDVELNKGIVIKYNANQSYTSDSLSSAILKDLAKKADVPVQEFTNRSDLRGGSTLGNLSNSEVSLTAVDIGIAQLSMHSSYEMLGVEDVERMINLCKVYFNSKITFEGESVFIK